MNIWCGCGERIIMSRAHQGLTGTLKSRGCLAGLTLALPPAGRKGYEPCIEGRALELGIKRGRKELAEEFQSDPGHWPGEARRIAATGAAEASLGAGL